MMEFLELAKVCAPDIHETTLVAVVRHESGFNPLIINVNGKPGRQIRPKTREQAIEAARNLLTKKASFDAGYGQINSANWKWLGITPETAFDPCTNLRAAQSVLVDCYERANKNLDGPAALYAALSCYNTGNFTYGLKNGYVRKVLAGAGITVPALPGVTPGAKATTRTQRSTATHTTPIRPANKEALEQSKKDAFPQSPPDAFARPRPDAFAQPRPDAFAQPRPDAFAQPYATRSSVGSIIYHPRAQP